MVRLMYQNLEILVTNPGGAITCDAPVDSFSLTFYKLAMCTSDPDDFIRGNSTTDPCYYVWNTEEGDNSISFGVTKSSETSFPATLPPSGTYTAAYAEMQLQFQLMWNLNLTRH